MTSYYYWVVAIFCQKLCKKNRENALLEKILKYFKNFVLIVLLSQYKSTKTRRKSDFLPIKNKKLLFLLIWQDLDPGSGFRIWIEILGWIRIKRMRIRNTDRETGTGPVAVIGQKSIPAIIRLDYFFRLDRTFWEGYDEARVRVLIKYEVMANQANKLKSCGYD